MDCNSDEMTINDATDAILALVRDTVKGAMPERKKLTAESPEAFAKSAIEKEGWNLCLDQIEASLKQAGVL